MPDTRLLYGTISAPGMVTPREDEQGQQPDRLLRQTRVPDGGTLNASQRQK
jgi:hypothetical protein